MQGQVEQRDPERAAKEHQEEGKQAPADAHAPAGGLWVVHAIKGSTAIATKSNAR